MVAEISLNGNVYGALVDTGADKSFILEDVVNKERLGVDDTNQRIRTVGSTVTSSGLVRAVVEVNGPKKELGLIVLKDLPYEIILGMDAIRELDILIDGSGNMVCANGASPRLENREKVALLEDLKVGTGNDQFVLARIPEGVRSKSNMKGVVYEA